MSEMNVPDVFKRAVGGFYQGALEYGGHTLEDCVAMGVARVPQSRCRELLEWLDTILVADPQVVFAAWQGSGCEYGWEDPEYTRGVFRLMRKMVAERVATGGGGMPG
ncbi:MAG: hypothetical protein LWW93_16780 [Hyphomicrobiales bacterium]|nr:hypothetical protein [Hyphomicrobiales bacterium]